MQYHPDPRYIDAITQLSKAEMAHAKTLYGFWKHTVKDPETFELIFKVDRITDTWKDNKAKQAKSIEGRTLMLAGFWNRKDEYHKLKVGNQIEVGMKHIGMRSEHLTVAEFVRKAERDD